MTKITNVDIDKHVRRLRERHYVLASAHPNDPDRFHVGPAQGPLGDYTERFGSDFALIIYKTTKKSPDVPLAFFVLPFDRVRSEFVRDRIDRADDSSWNAHILKHGVFEAGKPPRREIDVRDCRGSLPLPQRILAATLALLGDERQLVAALRELGGGRRS
jgi:hypothetical protein